MAKWGKKLVGLAVIGTIAGGIFYYFKKNGRDAADDFTDDFEDEDFDLDNDLKPVTDREYVPLNPANKEKEDTDGTAGNSEADSTEGEKDTSDIAESKQGTPDEDNKKDA